MCVYVYIYRAIGLMSKVFTNGPGDWSSIPGRVIPKIKRMLLDAAQHYNVRIKGTIYQPLRSGRI